MARATQKGGCACSAANQQGGYGGGRRALSWSLIAGLLVLVVVILLCIVVWLWTRAHSTTKLIIASPVAMRTPQAADATVNEVKPNKLPTYFNTEYQQVGILTSPNERENGDPMILPLFGRRMERHHRWQYYAASEKPQHLWRVPVHVGNRECEETVGCPEIQNGDTVHVPVYPNRAFIASMYKLDAPKYFADRV